jgi:antibiotic biosynthesis monooxygenase (ABM) superfamily enzyme
MEMPTPNQAAAGPQAPPPRHKMAILTWAGAWAMITLILGVLGPVTATWPLPLRTLVISVLMVLALTWVVIPTLTRVFAGWLTPAPPAANRGARKDRGWAGEDSNLRPTDYESAALTS